MVIWSLLAVIIMICIIILSPIIWLLTGKFYMNKIDDFLTNIADTIYHKGKITKKDNI
jgi:hypothetical protein